MKKTAKTLLATLLALTMLCALALPVWADNEDLSTHTFEAYQIFTGDVADVNGQNVLSNVQWGDGVKSDDLLNALQNNATLSGSFTKAKTARDVAEAMKDWHESDDNSIAFARLVYKYLDKKKAKTVNGTNFTAPQAGYYLIVDKIDSYTFSYNAKNFSILKVVDPKTPYDIVSKAVKPTVDIKVEDAPGTFGSSADHAINESFKFKMTATLPQSNAYKFYNKYPVTFTSTLNSAIQFDGNNNGDSDDVDVTITYNGSTKTINKVANTTDANGYYITFYEDKTTHEYQISVTINDVTHLLPAADLANHDATVEVTYKAHLKDTAAVTVASTSTTNTDSVYLIYPHDPHEIIGNNSTYSDAGRTAESKAYVYTYGVNIKKIDDSNPGKPLENAKFRLYSDETCQNEIALKKMTSTGNANEYCIATTGEELVTPSTGQIKINGLDAGTYYLKEIKAPDGYNTLEKPVKLEIVATHNGATVQVGLGTAGSGKMEETVINKSGVVLPSTGGMGTTIFYVVGGLLMVGAAVLLVTKKRMQKN